MRGLGREIALGEGIGRAPDLAVFLREAPRLLAHARRLLGDPGDAEDIVQEAWVRWHSRADGAEHVRDPERFLRSVVTRLCLDQLRLRRVRQREAVRLRADPDWLPPPEPPEDLPRVLRSLFERLSAAERAALLLHEVFEVPFDEIARTLERSANACRQLAHRARRELRDPTPRTSPAADAALALLTAFQKTAETGDLGPLTDALRRDL